MHGRACGARDTSSKACCVALTAGMPTTARRLGRPSGSIIRAVMPITAAWVLTHTGSEDNVCAATTRCERMLSDNQNCRSCQSELPLEAGN